jgi:hypothetical protein
VGLAGGALLIVILLLTALYGFVSPGNLQAQGEQTEADQYLPLAYHILAPTPTPTATPPPWYYFEDFEGDSGGWPLADNTNVSNDCFKWYLANNEYNVDICDDRTDVKVSPGVDLPAGDYTIEVDARFRYNPGGFWYWNSYGIMFDAKDDPDPSKPDLGDYYMLWVLWEGPGIHKYKIIKDIPGAQINLFDWRNLDAGVYNYGPTGSDWNTWRIERTQNTIRLYINDHFLTEVGDTRPTTNFQTLFGVFASTYETGQTYASFDNFLIEDDSGTSARPVVTAAGQQPIIVVNSGGLERLLPDGGR